jgi:hypothetical protein
MKQTLYPLHSGNRLPISLTARPEQSAVRSAVTEIGRQLKPKG